MFLEIAYFCMIKSEMEGIPGLTRTGCKRRLKNNFDKPSWLAEPLSLFALNPIQLRNIPEITQIFFSDVNECGVANGGCSHQCVNTAPGYRCECPDTEMSLSSDGKTCLG